MSRHRQQNQSAQKTYASLPASYAESRWRDLEASLLTRCAELQEQQQMPRERLLSCLALVRAGISEQAPTWRIPLRSTETSLRHTAAQLLKNIASLASQLDKGKLLAVV